MSRLPILCGVGLIVGLIVGLASGLYLPFIDNPPVFDDLGFFSGRLHSYYATHPFGLELRVPPYFSLAVVQVIWGSTEAHRIVSLGFHIACALALYKLIIDLQRYAGRGAAPAAGLEAHAPAVVAAAVFAVHPVAVYGAGYLIQRMTVFATLFSLISVVLYLRGLARRSHADAVSAALLYTIGVLSRENAVFLPAAVVAAGFIVAVERRFALRHAALYLVLCAPAAMLVTWLVKVKIGATYEPDFAVVSAQIAGAGAARGILGVPWLDSAFTQAWLFFRYLALWIFPDTGAMSIDIRVTFARSWPPGAAMLAMGGFLGYGALALLLLVRGGRSARVAGFGLLLPWVLFLTEFTTIRYQEPFVLYRSYLWAPGLMVLLAAVLSRMPMRAVGAFALLVLPVLFYQAHDRLRVFSSTLALWEDAAAKLPRRGVPGGSRTLYNLGREYLYRDQPARATAVVERCLAEYPSTYDCHYARGAVYLQQEQYREALPYLVRSIALRPESGPARHNLGLALENLGCLDEAREQYRLAIKLGFTGAAYRLRALDAPGSGLLRPVKPKPPSDVCGRPLPDGTPPRQH